MSVGIVIHELQNGPATAAEIAAGHGHPEAVIRNTLSALVFDAKSVTCDRSGRYRLGDPTPLIEMRGVQ